MKISAAIITLNEEANISSALDSVSWADEIVVLDSGSSDRTLEIARGMGARVAHQDWLGFGLQKQAAVELCTNDWILSIDADESITPYLQNEIKQLREQPEEELADGYLIPRRTTYMNREILHSGWYPDRQLRLFRKSAGRWKKKIVHESVVLNDGTKPGQLVGEISHVSVKSVKEHIEMIGSRYAPLGAEQMALDGETTSVVKTATAAPVAFLRSYVLKLGILDGFPGFCIGMFAAYNSFLKNLLLYEAQTGRKDQEKD